MSASKTATTTTWIVSGLAAFVFVASGSFKLTYSPQVVNNFHGWGMSESFLAFIGVVEILGGLGLLIPVTATLAASGLAIVMVGAIFTHLSHGEIDHAPVPLVLLLLVTYIAVDRRHAVAQLWRRADGGPQALATPSETHGS